MTTRWSALHFAAYNGNEEMVNLLLDKGADPFLNCRDSAKPIETAMAQGHYHIQKILWQKMRKIKHAGPKPELGAWGGAGQVAPDAEEGDVDKLSDPPMPINRDIPPPPRFPQPPDW